MKAETNENCRMQPDARGVPCTRAYTALIAILYPIGSVNPVRSVASGVAGRANRNERRGNATQKAGYGFNLTQCYGFTW